MLDVLVPVEGDPVIGHLEVRLAEELLAARRAEQLERRLDEPRIRAEPEQPGLGAARPYDPLHDHRSLRRRAQHEERAVVVARRAERLGGVVQAVERGAHARHFSLAEQPAQDHEPALVEPSPIVVRELHRNLRLPSTE
ncbi:MAG: hypothetical protein IPF92_10440 [Myxococcales bacterium]|nr:hypothetical protein [Myxococcales bacterium]